jgi:UDP-N-acetylglucosamine--N-acetylmuramyl-(pentapeptide) pyrophosphoryl-undecaprenol N-acetylglucosamine transferase
MSTDDGAGLAGRRPLSVVLAGGGTSGHIEPALALADALVRADPTTMITALGTERGLETRVVPARGYRLELIPAVPLPRGLRLELATLPVRMVKAVRAARAVLGQVQADVVVGFGGYVSLPAYLAARSRGVPIVVHEANALPGLANRVGARLSRYVATGQPGIQLRHARYVGIPLRRSITGLDREAARPAARAYFGLRPDVRTLLVSGGSQGARRLNLAVGAAAAQLTGSGIQVLHVTGPGNVADVAEVTVPPGNQPYVRVAFVEDMGLAYAAADMMLCRSGAITCAELAAIGLPAAYVPLPHGNGEQRRNAEPIVRAGGGLLVDDAELTPEWITGPMLSALTDSDRLAAMSVAARVFGRPDADAALAAMVIAAARGGRP